MHAVWLQLLSFCSLSYDCYCIYDFLIVSILSASNSGSLDSKISSSLNENPLQKTLCILNRRLLRTSFYKVSLGFKAQISVKISDSLSIFIHRPNSIMQRRLSSILLGLISWLFLWRRSSFMYSKIISSLSWPTQRTIINIYK